MTAKSITAYITPSVLRWARESMGYAIDDVANRLNKKKETVEDWEQDGTESFPTYSQLEKLAQFYKRPIAVFYFPTPPREEQAESKFRTLPSNYIKKLTPPMRFLLRKAMAKQLDLEELRAGGSINDELKQLKGRDINAQDMAARVRKILNIPIGEQFKWKDCDEALKIWREKLEDCGIWVFKAPFKNDDYCGFYLPHEQFPIIYLNSSIASKARQIFTLFHELGHFLLDKGGLDLNGNIESELKGNYKKEEVFCNAFSGAFLVPHIDIDWNDVSDENIQRNADKYKVSRVVILRKYLDREAIDSSTYNEKIREWQRVYMETKARKNEDKKGKKGGPSFHVVHRDHLGNKYLTLAFTRYYQKTINDYQLAQYLGVRLDGIQKMENFMK